MHFKNLLNQIVIITALLNIFHWRYRHWYNKPFSHLYNKCLPWNMKSIDFQGNEGRKLRALGYFETDIFCICFSIDIFRASPIIL